MLFVLPLATVSCAIAAKQSVLKVDSRALAGGRLTEARIEVPEGWYRERQTGSQASFVGPDYFSRILFFASQVPAEGCQALAEDAVGKAGDGMGTRPRAKLVSRTQAESGVSFTFRHSPENAPERVALGRAACGDGALFLVSCTFGAARQAELQPVCQKVVDSLATGSVPALEAKEQRL